jgi:membrane associated rhomboid family serine protease
MFKEYYERLIKKGNALTRLIVINVAVFLLLNILNVFFILLNINAFLAEAGYWLSLKSNVKFLLVQPWSIITHMFTHVEFFHLFWNMILLFMSGKIFLEFLSNKKLFSVYILGALSGAVLYILVYNLFPKFNEAVSSSYAIGASAGVLAILVSIAVYVPDYVVHLMFIGRVKLVYVASVFILLDILNFDKGNFGGHIAHIGGAIFGAFYGSYYKKGIDIGAWFSNFTDRLIIKNRTRLKVEYKRPVSDFDYNSSKAEKQKKMDEILDKISKSGYESLTKQEKAILFDISKKNN